MTDGPKTQKSLAQAVLDKLSEWPKPCHRECQTHASCLQENKIQDLLVMAHGELRQQRPLSSYSTSDLGVVNDALPPGYYVKLYEHSHPVVKLLTPGHVIIHTVSESVFHTSMGQMEMVTRAWKDRTDRIIAPRQNPGMCGTKHPWIQSIWQYGGRGEPLCGKCGHIEGGDCHQPLYDGLHVACSWCGALIEGKHYPSCRFTQAEVEINDAWDNGPKWSEHLMRDVQEALPTGYRIAMATPHRVQVVDECGCIATDLTNIGYEGAGHQNSLAKMLLLVREYVEAKTARNLKVSCGYCGAQPGKQHNHAIYHALEPQTGRLSTKESNLSNASRYWEDVVVERLQGKLPPGYTAKPVRVAPLRDEDGRVQMRDGQDALYATYGDILDFEHGVIKRAWKRFLDKGI